MELTAENVKQMINQQTAANNAWSAEQAQKQMDFQKMMSDTAHQREVADLKAAGLNPVLAANQGASSAAGASADPDQSGNNALVGFLTNLIQTQNQLELQKNNAELQRELTEKTNALTAMIAEMNRQVSIESSIRASEASRYAASVSAGAQQYSAYQNYLGSVYSADSAYRREQLAQDAAYQRLLAQGVIDESLQNGRFAQQEFMARNFPSTNAAAVAATAYNITHGGAGSFSSGNMTSGQRYEIRKAIDDIILQNKIKHAQQQRLKSLQRKR